MYVQRIILAIQIAGPSVAEPEISPSLVGSWGLVFSTMATFLVEEEHQLYFVQEKDLARETWRTFLEVKEMIQEHVQERVLALTTMATS